MKKLDQKGLAHIILLLIIVLILGAIGYTGWLVWEKAGDERDAIMRLEKPNTPCEGQFYDSHAHPDDDEILHRLPYIMTKYKIGCSVLFTQMDINEIDESLEEAREHYAGMPGRIAVFYDIIKDHPSEVTRAKLDELWRKSEGKFTGFGEFAFYEQAWQGKKVTDEGWSILFEFAAEKNLSIMIHPQQDMVASLELMLKRYPDTNVIVHGFELPNQMGSLLRNYPNLYFTLDEATFFVLGELTSEFIPEHLFYPKGGPGTAFDVDKFVSDYDSKREQVIQQAVDKWLPVLLAAPNKVMWGTDISLKGHVDERVFDRVVDLANAFTNKIPEQYRSGYVRDNAFKLLGEGVSL